MTNVPTTSMENLGTMAVDPNIIRKKQVGLMNSTQISGVGEEGKQVQSNLLKPGNTYSAPTKFSPFRPLDLYPFGLKSSDFSENPNLYTPTATSGTSSSVVTPKTSKNPWNSPTNSIPLPSNPTSKLQLEQNSILSSSEPKVLSTEHNPSTGPVLNRWLY